MLPKARIVVKYTGLILFFSFLSPIGSGSKLLVLARYKLPRCPLSFKYPPGTLLLESYYATIGPRPEHERDRLLVEHPRTIEYTWLLLLVSILLVFLIQYE